MCGTNEKTGMPIMEIPFTINSRGHRPHLTPNAARVSGLILSQAAFQPLMSVILSECEQLLRALKYVPLGIT